MTSLVSTGSFELGKESHATVVLGADKSLARILGFLLFAARPCSTFGVLMVLFTGCSVLVCFCGGDG